MPYTWMGMFVMRLMIPRGIIAPGRAMTISGIDWAIVAAYFLLSAGIGPHFPPPAPPSPPGGAGALDRPSLPARPPPGGRPAPGVPAPPTAADPPLVVPGLVARRGVAGNGLWWTFVRSGILPFFFSPRLWRRAEVM